MSVAQWSRQFYAQIEVGNNQVGSGSDLLNNLPTLLASTAPSFSASDIGMEGDGTTGGKHKLLLNNKPAILPSTAVQDSRKTTGTPDPSEKDIEVTIAEPPEVSLEMNMSAYAINMGLLLLFQQGSTQKYVTSLKSTEAVAGLTVADAATTTITASTIGADVPSTGGYVMNGTTGEIFKYTAHDGSSFTGCTRGQKGTTAAAMAGEAGGLALVETQFKPYTTAECIYYAAVLEKTRKLYGSNPYNESILSRGNIAKTFNLEFQEGGVAAGSIGVVQAQWKNNYDAQSINSAASAMATLKWQNAFAYLMDDTATPSSSTHKVWLQGITMNAANNASVHFYNSDEVKNFTLGDLVITGNIQVPWVANAERSEYYFAQINAFKSGAKKRLILGWGYEGASDLSELGRADNGFTVDMYIQYSGADRTGDNQIVSDMEYKNILPEGKSQSVVFKTYTYVANLDRGLPATP